MNSNNGLNNIQALNQNSFNNINLNNDINDEQMTSVFANVLNNPFLVKNLTGSILLNINNRGIKFNNNTNLDSTNNAIKQIKIIKEILDSDEEPIEINLESSKENVKRDKKTIKTNINKIKGKSGKL